MSDPKCGARHAHASARSARACDRSRAIARLRAGDVVWLRANRREGWKRERADVLEIQRNGMLTVVVAPEGRDDDGVREVTTAQVASVERRTK